MSSGGPWVDNLPNAGTSVQPGPSTRPVHPPEPLPPSQLYRNASNYGPVLLQHHLENAPTVERGRFGTTAQATLVYHTFQALWSAEPNGEAYFIPPGERGPQKGEWTRVNSDGVVLPFSLSDRQEKWRAAQIRHGKLPDRRPGPCGKVIARHERYYTCKTCGVDHTNVICVDCYQASDHSGHDVTFGQSFSFVTVCDCGQPSAWKDDTPVVCANHPLNSRPPQESIPSTLRHSIQDTITVILDFVIETLQHSPSPADFSQLSATAEAMRAGLDLHTRGSSEPIERRGLPPWSCVLWADEKHVLRELTRQIRDGTGCDWKRATRMAREAELVGRRVIATSDDMMSIYHSASMLFQIDLSVTLRQATDTFREQACATLLALLADLVECTVGTDHYAFQHALAKALFEPRRVDTQGRGAALSSDLKALQTAAPYVSRMEWIAQLDYKLWKAPKFALRKIFMAVYHTDAASRIAITEKFAKSFTRIFEHYLFQDREIDTNLAYSSIHHFFRDGDAAAHAVKTGAIRRICDAAQLWYSGMIEHNRLQFSHLDVDHLDKKSSYNADSVHYRNKKGLQLFSFLIALLRHRQVAEVFISDPSYLRRVLQFLNPFVGLQAQKRARETHVEFEPEFHKTYFVMGEVAKLCRAVGELYARAPGDTIMEALRMVKDRIFNDMLLHTRTLSPDHFTPPSHHRVNDVLGNGNEVTCLQFVVSHSHGTSFHHYMHLVFAEIIKGLHSVVQMNDGTLELRALFEDHLFAADHLTPGLPLLTLIEDSLQKHVVVSQVRLGHWARNGMSMRSQIHYYADGPMHEYTIDQEFFLLQVGLCAMDPLVFITAAIDRYELSDFFRGPLFPGTCWEGSVDPAVKAGLLADFLRLLIALVSDTWAITNKSHMEISRKYVIHFLALAPHKYNALLKRMPDRCSDRGSIEPILAEVADFKPPTVTAEGSYSLKAEFYDEVDPFFHHYQSNERDGARKILLARAAKKNADKKVDPFLLPLKLDIPPAPRIFHNIAAFLKQDVCVAVCHYAISHCVNMDDPSKFPGLEFATAMPQLEGVLEAALHLCMLSIQIDAEAFAVASQVSRDNTSTSIFRILWYINGLNAEIFKPFKPSLDYIINSIISNLPEQHAAEAREAVRQKKQAENEAAANAPENPIKAKAAARRQALMAKLSKQQADFKSSQAFRDIVGDNDDAEIEDDEESNEEIHGTCINCQDEVSASKPGGMLAMLQPSRILREVAHDREWLIESLRTPCSLDKATRHHRYGWGTTGESTVTDGYPSAQLRLGINILACGHLMHDTCLRGFFEMTQLRHEAQLQRHPPENAARMEYICPLCKSLSNVLIPIDKTTAKLAGPLSKVGATGGPLPLSERIRMIFNEGLLRVSDSSRIWDHHIESGELVLWYADRPLRDENSNAPHREGSLRAVAKMVDRLRSLTKPTSEQSMRLRKKSHAQNMYLPEDMVGYTVAMHEIAQRGVASKGLTVAENLNETVTRTIKALVGTLQLELDLHLGRNYDRSALRVGIFARFMPYWYRNITVVPGPLLCRDPFGIVVEVAAIAPDVIQSVIHLGYYSELTRTVLGLATWVRRCIASSTAQAMRPSQPHDEDLEEGLEVFKDFRGIVADQLRVAGAFADAKGFLGLLSDESLSKLLYSHTLPYLRRCAILYYSLHGTYPVPDVPAGGSEYRRLLNILGIPDPHKSLTTTTSTEYPIVNHWIAQWHQRSRVTPPLEFPGIYELYRLPKDYETLMLMVAKRKCGKCGHEPSVPALCLFCGKFLCLSGDCCAEGEQGECNLHMRECGATAGMFLDIKRWMIAYLFAGTGSFGSTPYLDVHGEVDMAMRRGHLQYLHEGRADEIRRSLWLQHGIPSFTARKLELMTDMGGWGTI